MYRLVIICLLLLFFASSVMARIVSLDQAVSQIKRDKGGQVISARTVSSGQTKPYHEIRMLDTNGMIKTYRVPTGENRARAQRPRQEPNMGMSDFDSNYNRNRRSNSNISNSPRARTELRSFDRAKSDNRSRSSVQEKKDKR